MADPADPDEDDHGHRATYDRSAAAWDAARAGSFAERAWIEAATAALRPGDAVLDLGCGAGAPVASHLLARGLRVTGLDQSAAMLALARARHPQAEWIRADMRGLALGRRFAAVIAWDSLFHLRAGEQRDLIARVADHLRPGGTFLFTCGPDAGEVWGAVQGGPVWHASLSPAGYATTLEGAGLLPRRFHAQDGTAGGHSIWLAQKPG